MSLSADGSLLAVGARDEDSSVNGVNGTPNDDANGAGAVYVFVRNGSTWSQQAFIKATNPGAGDAFGLSVAMSLTGLAVGGIFEDSSATGVNGTPDELLDGSGAVYTYLRN